MWGKRRIQRLSGQRIDLNMRTTVYSRTHDLLSFFLFCYNVNWWKFSSLWAMIIKDRDTHLSFYHIFSWITDIYSANTVFFQQKNVFFSRESTLSLITNFYFVLYDRPDNERSELWYLLRAWYRVFYVLDIIKFQLWFFGIYLYTY